MNPTRSLGQTSSFHNINAIPWQSHAQPSMNMYDGLNFLPSPAQQQQQQPSAQQMDNDFDEAAFERAFDVARLEIEQSESKGKDRAVDVEHPGFDMANACTEPGDVLGEYDFDHNAEMLGARDKLDTQRKPSSLIQDAAVESSNTLDSEARAQPLLGSDTIPADDPAKENDINPEAQADELARTAGQLLDSLKAERSDKFQQSSFMELMRQLRDKEVHVDGDKMVAISDYPRGPTFCDVPMQSVNHAEPAQTTQSSHPGGREYPYDAFNGSKQPTAEDAPGK